ncbi:mucin-2 isoform X3 [Anoplophora glabripennis]|uniref:mucin-2 isoform X3 n=1 Tax=Anoplophora glabripennis TaxID=217634 RepID=UPI000873B92D|nr:mucin-2 isoform X3 [Anoplophora glabripennis]
MANKDDYLTYYREFFENFAQTVNPNDQLPVKLASYKLVNIEVVGGIIDWTTQYLTQKQCPANLIGPLIKIVIEEIRKACKKQPILCGFNPSDNAYEPLKLMQTVMAKTNEVCLRYLDNSMLCSLPSPGTPYFPTSVYAVKNSRRRMEDRHVVIHDLNTMFNIQEASPSSYYAVFDGHAGHDAAAYSSAHLHQFLAENKHFVNNPEQALLDAFCKTDALFTDKCKVENLSSGTTAVVALLRPKEKSLYIAWVGDSQALLVNQGRVLQVVNPHKPSRQDERERIEKQGGCVLLWGTWRVNGQLAVSRAIGDAEYKPFVIAIPDVREIPLDGGEDFLILACDGLWDFVSEDLAARTVYNLVTEDPGDVDRISQYLVQLSRDQGSLDNISVIVVFLREPSKIAAEAHWANRNRTTTTMDASLDNANNPFAISNGAPTDNIISQKSDGLLLNLTDNFKQNGTDISPTADFYPKEKSNGKRSASEFDDDDFGPETDVDAVDDALSPVETAKGFGDVFTNNNPAEGVCNPFIEHQEKAALEIERELQKQQSADAEEPRLAREETPTPPADAVHDVSGLVDNAAESESEDEWNYIKGDDANKENISPQPEKEVAEVPEEDDTMSQLNPNAAEFIPVSPTRSIPSPACRLLNDQVISQSPRRPTSNDIDINVPNAVEFEKEVKSRPSEVESYSNGHDESDHISSADLMENLLNGKNIDEIPEFQPGSTPSKIVPSDEFHFGPNAAPFTPAKFMDQSETGLSTRAVYGDESTATLGTSFNESEASQDTAADLNLLNKESDPMSMSFYADKGESNPFDLNQVHILPEDLDEFLNKPDNTPFDETISDLPEHQPLGEHQDTIINNDDAIQITDLDKQSYDDEKELASPLEPEKELSEVLTGGEECDLSKTPEPTHENLLGQEFCGVLEPSKASETEALPRDVELISPEPSSKLSESSHENYESKSPLPGAIEVPDLLQSQPESLPRDVELISPELKSSRPGSSLTHEESSKSPQPEGIEVEDLLRAESKSPAPEATEVNDLLGQPDNIQSKSPLPEASEVNDLLQESKSPLPESESKSPALEIPEAPETIISPTSDLLETKSPVDERSDAESPVCERPGSKSPVCELPVLKSPVCELENAKSPVCERPISESPICQLGGSNSPVCERPVSESPVCERPISESPVCDKPTAESPIGEQSFLPICERPVSKSPVCERPISESPVCERPTAESPIGEQVVSLICERPISESPVCERPISKSPVCEKPVSESPVCERPISESPVCELPVSKSPVCERPISESPVCERPVSESPVCERPISESPVYERRIWEAPDCEYRVATPPISESPVVELEVSKSPAPELETAKSPILEPELAKSPIPEPEVVKSPEPELAKSPEPELAKSPVPELEMSKSPIPEPELAKSPIPEPELTKSPVPELEESKSPVCELPLLRSPVPQSETLAPLLCDISASKSPELLDSKHVDTQGPLTPDYTKEEEIVKADTHFELICKSPEDLGDITPDFTKPYEIEKAQEHFEGVFKPKDLLESPQEDVTSSLKDEASPAPSPLPSEVIEESFVAGQALEVGAMQNVSDVVEESIIEAASPVPELETCPIMSPKSAADTESVVTSEVNSLLEKSLPPEIASSISPTQDIEEKQRFVPDVLDLNRPPSPTIQSLSAQAGEEIDIKTENITPEFAVQTIVVTPSEESKQEDVPSAPPAEELVPEPAVEEQKKDALAVGVPEAVAAAVGVAAVAGVAAAAVPAVVKSEKEEKKKPASTVKKTTTSKSATTKPAAKTSTVAPKTSPHLSASPRVAAAKTSAAKSPTATPKPSATRLSPRPKPSTTAAPKSTEKKPLTNGDVKPTGRSSLTSRKVTSETTTTAAKPRTSTGTTRSSLTKPAPPKPTTARPTSATKTTTTTRTTTTTGATSAAPPKPRPTTLSHRTATTTSTAAKTLSATKTPPAKTSPKTATAPKPRPPTTTTVLKQRVPLTKTVTKAADTEKQNKESANKLTASRTVTSTTRTASATARSTTTTLRKVESKVSATRTSKTTTTTMKSTTAKKPTELVRNVTSKTRTTKVEKPKQNGVATLVTEEITVATVVNNTIEGSEPQLLKDNSPMDNKLIMESALIQTNTAD